MSFHTIVRFLQFVLPRPLFRKFRRTVPLCKYNIHSASKQLRNHRRYKRLPPVETCEHCGLHVYCDGRGQWRAHVILPQSAIVEQGLDN